MNALQLDGIWMIAEGIGAFEPKIKGMLKEWRGGNRRQKFQHDGFSSTLPTLLPLEE